MLDVVMHTCHPRCGGKCTVGQSQSRPVWVKSQTISKITRVKRAGSVAQVVEFLPTNGKYKERREFPRVGMNCPWKGVSPVIFT
jgi:hypothetical protein